jgi:hypothetical protein
MAVDLGQAIQNYADSRGLNNIRIPKGLSESDKWNCSATNAEGKLVFLTFDPGTIPDGTYNLFERVDGSAKMTKSLFDPSAFSASTKAASSPTDQMKEHLAERGMKNIRMPAEPDTSGRWHGSATNTSGRDVAFTFDPNAAKAGSYKLFQRADGERTFTTSFFTPGESPAADKGGKAAGGANGAKAVAPTLGSTKDTESFKRYMQEKLGLTQNIYISEPTPYTARNGVKSYKYSCSGTDKTGKPVYVDFDAGTKPDGTFNILVTRGSYDGELEFKGVIKPGAKGSYTLPKAAGNAVDVEKEDQAPKDGDKKTPPPKHRFNPKGGKVHAYRVIMDESGAGKNGDGGKEVGKIVICQDNKILGTFNYISGPYKNGSAPNVPCTFVDSKEIATFYYRKKDGTVCEQLGLRIKDSSFSGYGRDGILVHCDLGVTGTIGCFGVAPGEWSGFKSTWGSIPVSRRPGQMTEMTPTVYAGLQKKSSEQMTADAAELESPVASVSSQLLQPMQEQMKKHGVTSDDAPRTAQMDSLSHTIETLRNALSQELAHNAPPKAPGRSSYLG